MILRFLLATLGLVLLGAGSGAAVGVLMMLMWVVAGGAWSSLDAGTLQFGAAFGALMGAALGPPSAWLFLRRVPLWRAATGAAFGTLLGALAGLVAGGPGLSMEWAYLGFGASSLAMWAGSRRGLPIPGASLPARLGMRVRRLRA